MAAESRVVWQTVLRRHWPWLVLASMRDPGGLARRRLRGGHRPRVPHGRVARRSAACRPSAYRLAEPGDTLDRIMIYLAAAGVVLAAGGLAAAPRPRALAGRAGRRAWPASGTARRPGPAVDGWYGLGWRTIADPRAPLRFALGLLAAAVALAERRRRRRLSRERHRLGEDLGRLRGARGTAGSGSRRWCWRLPGSSRSRASSRSATGRAGR